MLENGNAHQGSLADSGKYTVMMNMAPSHTKPTCIRVHPPTVPRFETRCCNGAIPNAIWEPLEQTRRMRATPTAWKWTFSERASVRPRQMKNVNSRKAPAPGISTQTHVTTVAHLDIGRTTGGNLVEMQITAPTAVSTWAKVKGERAKGKQGTLCRRTAILARVTLRKRHRSLSLLSQTASVTFLVSAQSGKAVRF